LLSGSVFSHSSKATTSQVGVPAATSSATSRKKFSKAVGLMTSMMSAGTQEPAKTDLALRHTRILVFARVTIRRAHEADLGLWLLVRSRGKPDSS
jgi:hypothetical protein